MRKIAGMSPAERARLVGQLRKSAGAAVAAGAQLVPRPDALEASFVQEQLWFLHQLAPEQPSYNVSFSFRLRGPLDRDRLVSTVDGIVARHGVLRSRLVLRAGTLLQVPDVDMPSVELVDVPAAEADAWVRSMSRTPFVLGTGPLSRVALLRLADDDHLLVWIAHHSIMDGWSFGLLLDELCAGYAGAALPEVALQYTDVTAWQRERLSGGELAGVLDKWRSRLADAPSVAVPTDRPRPVAQTFDGSLVRFSVPADVAAGLASVADSCGATVFSTLLAAYQVLVARWCDAPGIVVGVPLSGRGRPELDKVVGPLANTLPIRADLPADAAFSAVLREVNGAVLDAIEGQDVPFTRLVELLEDGRDPSKNPLFQVLFNLGNLPQAAELITLGPDVELVPGAHPNGTIRMDLELTMEQAAGGLTGRLEYNTALFEAATAESLVSAYQRLLATIATSPDTMISALPGMVRPATPAPRPPASSRVRRSRSWADIL